MTVQDLVDKLNLKVLSGADGIGGKIAGCHVSDLISDVVGNAKEGDAWITLQSHRNIVAAALLKKLSCIILVNGIEPSAQARSISNNENIPILSTQSTTFETTGLIYNLLSDKL